MSAFHRDALSVAPRGFTWSSKVAFQHVDAAGVVFFATIQTYFHEAMVAWLDHAGLPLHAQLRAGAGVAPLVHAEADYRRPLRFGDAFDVSIVACELGKARFTLGFRLDLADGAVAATGHTVHVWVDPVRFEPEPLPAAVRAAFAPLCAAPRRGQAAG